MQSLKSRIVKATAVVLVLAVAHLCVNAELVRAEAARLIASVAPQVVVQGRLTTRGNHPVTVNGNSAKSGETIFSGQSILTPDGVGATVNLPGLGRVDMAPNTDITLSFEAGKINVTLIYGCVVLTADKGTTGTLVEGNSTRQTDPAKSGTLDTCGAKPAGAIVPAAGGISTLGKVGLIVAAAGAATTAAILIPCRRGANPSPGDPRGRNDVCRN
jgi:hypothetical protein